MWRPTLSRSVPTASSCSTPTAFSTAETAAVPEWHAADADAATSSLTFESTLDATQPRTANDKTFGSAFTVSPAPRGPLTAHLLAPRRSSSAARNESRCFAEWAAIAAPSANQMSAAAPRATIFGTASVPARRPFSWPPPYSIEGRGTPSRWKSAATPLGAPNLWPTSVR